MSYSPDKSLHIVIGEVFALRTVTWRTISDDIVVFEWTGFSPGICTISLSNSNINFFSQRLIGNVRIACW